MGRVDKEKDERIDLEILKILSMNGRATMDFIGERVGLSKHPTYRRVKALEEKYGIRYLPEIDVSKFGYLSYVAFVKFRNKRPNLNEIKKSLENEPHVQLVLLTSGEYDLIIYFFSNDHKDVAYFIFRLKTTTIFGDYPSDWYFTPHYGASAASFVSIRDSFFELLKDNLWHKEKTRRRQDAREVTEREFNLLRELNRNGAINFTEVDTKYNQGFGASRYAYQKLIERGILKRMTISMTNLPIKYHSIFLTGSFYGNKFKKTRPYLLLDIINDGPIVDKYAYVSDIGIPAGVMLVMPVFNDTSLKETEDYMENKIKWITLNTLIVTAIPIGTFAYRRFDKTYTNQYKLLVEEYKLLKYNKKIDYQNTDKTKKAELELIETQTPNNP